MDNFQHVYGHHQKMSFLHSNLEFKIGAWLLVNFWRVNTPKVSGSKLGAYLKWTPLLECCVDILTNNRKTYV